MSKKSSLNILGESHMPSDLFTPTLGSNYGLDGFEDMQYGMGVLEGVLDPQYTQAPALPTGVQLASAEGMDLSEMLEDTTPLTDLTWLDPSQLQDPERLPKTPKSIPELEEAWGRSTDGVRVWVRDLDEANFQESLRETPDKKAKLTPYHIRTVVSHAMRRSVQGHDIKAIMKEALESVGSEAENLLPYLKPMRDEHGLAGRVFIRASAYPNWGTGKWATEAKKHASRAKYLVVSERDLQGAAWIEDGRCKYTSKLAVTEVPWSDALAHYKPLLEPTGRRVAGGDPKRALQAAFLSLYEKKQVSTDYLPVHIAPSQRVGGKEARTAFQSYQPEHKVYDPSAGVNARKRVLAEIKIGKLASANLISEETKNRILSSGASPENMVRVASLQATRVKQGVYAGDSSLLEKQRTFDAAQADRRSLDSSQASARLARHDPSVELKARKRVFAEIKIGKLASANLISEETKNRILSSGASPENMIQVASLEATRAKQGVYVGDSSLVEKQRTLDAVQADRRSLDSSQASARLARYDPSAGVHARKRVLAEIKIGKLASANMISEETKNRILSSGEAPEEMVRVASIEATRVKQGVYVGDSSLLEKQRTLDAAQAERRSLDSSQASSRLAQHESSLAQHKEAGWKSVVAKWVSDKIVTAAEVSPLLKEHGSYEKVSGILLPKALRAAAQIRKAEYGGSNRALEALQDLEGSRQEKRAQDLEDRKQDLEREATHRASGSTLAARSKKEIHARVAKVQGEISRGLRGAPLRNFIAKTIPKGDAPEALRMLKGSLGSLADVAQETQTYENTQFTRFASERSAKSVLAGQIMKAANWLRRTMSEGFAGKDLDDMVTQRLSESLRQASDSQLREIRAQHEGVSGFLYVDAEAYASPSGVSGCEQGALRHRANKIPSVTEMPRCATCAMVRVLEDGTRKCGVYSKVLSDFSGEDLGEIRESNIRATNMTDVELTTSYFSPTYDPSDFGLDNSVLEGIDLDLPEDLKISDVTFGGWDF